MLPLKRMKVQHKAFSNECQQSPVGREENYSLLSQNTGHNLEKNKMLNVYKELYLEHNRYAQIFHQLVKLSLTSYFLIATLHVYKWK